MEAAIILALVKEVVGILSSEAVKEIKLLWGFKEDVLTLKDDFISIVAVLEDAELEETRKKENTRELWLQRLRSASLKVENVMAEISTEALLQRLQKKRGTNYMVRAFFTYDHNQLLFRIRSTHKVNTIRSKLDVIASDRLKYFTSRTQVHRRVECEMPNMETSSAINYSLILGREKEKEMIVEAICNKDIGKYDNGEIRVYCMWGMGGVGKTTLAKLVYNHEKVNKYFNLKCWICVSEKIQVMDILTQISQSIDKHVRELTQPNVLVESIQEKLRRTKFLIVLDNVSNEHDQDVNTAWEELSTILSCQTNGSIVMMTTRSQSTSRMMAKLPELQHKVGCLSEDNSWLLFKKLAFAQGRQGGDVSELEPIGREIVEKCKGLPLAVKTLGTLMWSETRTEDWERVKRSNLWEWKENDILPSLKLSYENLRPHVKRCFAYCCLFPKGYDIEKDVVIQLWVSNGFIPRRGETDMYVLGEETFNILVWRSFFEVNDKKYYGVDRYKMHDLMHDLAQHVMRRDCVVIEPGKQVIIPDEVLYLSSSCPDSLFSLEDLGKLAYVRSIFMFRKMHNSFSQIFDHKYVKVLYLCGIWLTTLPESICKLKHLKYLNLSHSMIEVLPENIFYLQNLQVLLLCSCQALCELPKRLGWVSSLQRLDISGCHSLSHLPVGMKELTSLRILPWFLVGKESGAKIGELADLKSLEGELEISGLENIGGLDDAKSGNLKYKGNLSVLTLSWSSQYIRESYPLMLEYDEEVLEGLEPNPCLKKLNIEHYNGKIISPSWMVNLRNLVNIFFSSCEKCEHIPPLGRLPNLKAITLSMMHSLNRFHDNDRNMSGETNMFPCLQKLDIYDCPNLVSLPSNLPKLNVLIIRECRKLVYLPEEIQNFKFMNKLVIRKCEQLFERYEEEIGEEWNKISHIPNIKISSPR